MNTRTVIPIIRSAVCVIALLMAFGASGLMAGEPKSTLREYCAAESKIRVNFPKFMRWDCQSVQAESLSELELLVGQTHSKKDYPSFRAYSSEKPYRSEWYFHDGYAFRYRAIYEGDEYQCLGVTTYCAGSEQLCQRVESQAASDLPPPLMPDTSAPGPHCVGG